MRLGIDLRDRLDYLLVDIGRLRVIRTVLCRLRGHRIKMDAGKCIRCGLSELATMCPCPWCEKEKKR